MAKNQTDKDNDNRTGKDRDEGLFSSDWAKPLAIGAAAGVATGLLANLVRKAVVQAPTAMAGNWDEALAAEHRMTLGLFDKLEATDTKDSTKRSFLLMQLKHALTKHAVEEENVVYAMMRDENMEEAADHLYHDHSYVKQYLFELTELPKDSPEWLPKLREFRAKIEEHVREEEDDLFPKMRNKLSEEQNKHITLQMNKEGLKVA